MCRQLTGWSKKYGGRSVHTEAMDVMAFIIVSDDKEKAKKGSQRKEITCFRCKKVSHYAS